MLPTQSLAAYNRQNAIVDAAANSYSYHFDWYRFNSDCTNFVSVSSWRTTGLSQDKPLSLPAVTTSDWSKGYSVNSTTSYWYMEPQTVKKFFINKTIWCYSTSWAVVKDFRNYMGLFGSSYIGCSSVTVTPYTIYTNAEVNTLCCAVQPGDVVQKGNAHSIMILTAGSTTTAVKFSGHSNDRCMEPFSTFINDCINSGEYTVHVIHFD